MMLYEKWSNEINTYDLYEGYSIHKADWKEFSVFFAIYRVFNNNIWFRQSFEAYCSVLKDCNECYWIEKDYQRIGGVLLEPNYMNCLFLIPPYSDYDTVLAKLKNIIIHWSDRSKKFFAGGILPEQTKHFHRLGFRTGKSRRCMIRPTEEFQVNWNDEYEIVLPTKENEMELVELFNEAFKGGIDYHDEENQIEIKYYLDENLRNDIVNRASTLVYDKKTNHLIGACLISIWEGWPNIYDVVVKPSFRGKGLATNMIKKALTILKEQYPVLRLFVTLGNDAEKVYYKMGFLAGVETTEMFIPANE